MGALLRLAVLLVAAVVIVGSGCAKTRKDKTVGVPEVPESEFPPETEPAPEPAPDAEVQLAFERGTTALGAGRYSEAIPHLYEVLREQPSHTLARYNLGVALQRVRQWQESVDVLSAARTDDLGRRSFAAGVEVPENADADYVHALGAAFQELRQFDQALACFDGAIELDRTHLKSRYARALCLQLRGDLAGARTAWLDYIARDPNSSWTESARKNLAEVESRLGSKAR